MAISLHSFVSEADENVLVVSNSTSRQKLAAIRVCCQQNSQIHAFGKANFNLAATLARSSYGVPPQQISSPNITPRAWPAAISGRIATMNVSNAVSQPENKAFRPRSKTPSHISNSIFILNVSVIVLFRTGKTLVSFSRLSLYTVYVGDGENPGADWFRGVHDEYMRQYLDGGEYPTKLQVVSASQVFAQPATVSTYACPISAPVLLQRLC